MNQLNALADAVRLGGWMVYPLSLLAIIGGAVALERAYVWWRCARVPKPYNFEDAGADAPAQAQARAQANADADADADAEVHADPHAASLPASTTRWRSGAMPGLAEVQRLAPGHVLRRLAMPFEFADREVRHLEMRIETQALRIQRDMSRGLWLLETIVTAAPLMGLLGTIVGMMQSFRLFGTQARLDPGSVTGGVAQALVATALGLVIALGALFAFNFFVRASENLTDTLEMCANQWLIESTHSRLDEAARIP
jgi:biopolymer transport protein ExbB